jgi:pantothenate kinase
MFRTLCDKDRGHEHRTPMFNGENYGPAPGAQLVEAEFDAIMSQGLYVLIDQKFGKSERDCEAGGWTVIHTSHADRTRLGDSGGEKNR